jgi:hypothetical protein
LAGAGWASFGSAVASRLVSSNAAAARIARPIFQVRFMTFSWVEF